jgi:hypothetical protein
VVQYHTVAAKAGGSVTINSLPLSVVTRLQGKGWRQPDFVSLANDLSSGLLLSFLLFRVPGRPLHFENVWLSPIFVSLVHSLLPVVLTSFSFTRSTTVLSLEMVCAIPSLLRRTSSFANLHLGLCLRSRVSVCMASGPRGSLTTPSCCSMSPQSFIPRPGHSSLRSCFRAYLASA